MLQAVDKTAKLLVAVEAGASTHWVQSELDKVCHTARLLAYMIHQMLHELLYPIDLHSKLVQCKPDALTALPFM